VITRDDASIASAEPVFRYGVKRCGEGGPPSLPPGSALAQLARSPSSVRGPPAGAELEAIAAGGSSTTRRAGSCASTPC